MKPLARIITLSLTIVLAHTVGHDSAADSPVESGGDDCPGTIVNGLYLNDVGDTTGANDTVSTVIGCGASGNPAEGPDHIYQITIHHSSNNLEFILTTADPSYDPSFYIVADCGVEGLQCIAGADECLAADQPENPCGQSSDESVYGLNLEAGVYYLFIDSKHDESSPTGRQSGAYEIVFLDFPVELMAISVE